MNTILITALSAALLSPAAPPGAPPRPAEDQLTTGKVLVLVSGGTLIGDIERVADRYRVCRDGGETWVPGDRVLRLCATPSEAAAALRARLKTDDVDGRLRLAEWCRENGLLDEALTDVMVVLALHKDHPRARAMRAALDGHHQTPPPAVPMRQVSAIVPPRVDLTAEALNQFSSRIQPILMNACVGCHNDLRGTVFRLTRPGEFGLSARAALHQNAAAVLAFVNLSQPQSSPFLTKAMSVHWYRQTDRGPLLEHGDPSLPAIQNRHAPAFRALEDWVRLVQATCPPIDGLQPVITPLVPQPTTAPVEPRSVPVIPAQSGTDEPRPYTVVSPQPTPADRPTVPAKPEVCAAEEFNRGNHLEPAKPSEMPPH